MYFNRWATFSASALLQVSCSGITYAFSIIAPMFKEVFKLTEVQVATIGSLGFNLGGYLAIISGAVYNSLGGKNHLAPRVVIWIGILQLACGYGGIYACAVGLIQPSFPILITFAFIAGNSGTWFDTAALVTNVRNFPDDRGTVVGILKAFLGLSGTLYAMVYSSQFQPDIKHFVLFLACVPACFALLMSVFVNLVPHEYHEVSLTGMSSEEVAVLPHNQRPPHIPRGLFHMSKATRFLMVYILVAVMAVYGMVSSVWSSEHHLDSEVRQIISGILLALLSIMLLVPIAVGPCTYPRRRLHSQRSIMQIQADASSPLLRSEQGEAGVEEAMSSTEHGKLERSSSGFSECSTDFNDTLPPVEMGPLQAATCLSFWLIFYSYAIGVGTGLTLLNNLASIVLALGGKPGGQVVFVALFSVANASGRLLNGYISEYFLHKHGTNRTNFLSAVAILMTMVAAAGLCISDKGDLYSMSLLGGLAFGGFWSVIPAIVSDLFGLASFASNYTVLQLAPACGGYILATALSSYEYAKASRAQGGDGRYCEGKECYTQTWTILIFLNFMSILGTRYLVHITKDVYVHMEQMKQRRS